MKHITYVIGVFMAFTINTLNAQNTEINFGVKAGVNYSNVWDSEGQEFEADGKIGFVGRFFTGISLNKYLGLQPEILFSQKSGLLIRQEIAVMKNLCFNYLFKF
jgi:hypothetical protein